MTMTPNVLRFAACLLTFRSSGEELRAVGGPHLAFGLLCTWLVGMGRSWDDREASLPQHLGVGSLVYVFILAFLLWATVAPIASFRVKYWQVLTFICLASPPGLLYAIPVEQFTPVETAQKLNVSLLLVVASWRVALLIFYLTRGLQLRPLEVFVTTTLPLATILAPLAVFNMLERIASAMGGLRKGQKMSEPATEVINWIGGVSIMAWLPLVVTYLTIRFNQKKS